MLLSGKAGSTTWRTGLGLGGAVRKGDSTASGHSHYLGPPMYLLSSGTPQQPYAQLHPALGTGGRGSLGSCSLCLPSIPPSPSL